MNLKDTFFCGYLVCKFLKICGAMPTGPENTGFSRKYTGRYFHRSDPAQGGGRHGRTEALLPPETRVKIPGIRLNYGRHLHRIADLFSGLDQADAR